MGLIKDELEELGFKVTGKSCKDTSIRNVLKRFKENYEGANITVDAQISATSKNPVQNKIIKQALDGKATYDGFKTFLNQPMRANYMETDLALPHGSLSFSSSNRTNISETLWNYLYRKSPIGYTFLLNLYHTNLGTRIADVNCHAIIIGESFSSSSQTQEMIKILSLALESNLDKVQKGLYHILDLWLYQNSLNMVEIHESNYHELLSTDDVDRSVVEDSKNPVAGGAVYDYVQEIKPNYVSRQVVSGSQYQDLLMNYADDYMAGLGKVFYWKFNDETPMIYECFMSATVDMTQIDPVPIPMIRYIDAQGVAQTIDPTSLDGTNYLIYTGYHYGSLPDEENSREDSGGGSAV